MKFYEALAQAQKGGRILSTKNTNKVWAVDNDRLLKHISAKNWMKLTIQVGIWLKHPPPNN